MINVLVTGGCGFIGSHVVDLLLNQGYNVTIVDNLDTGKLSNLEHLNPYSNQQLKFCKDEFDGFKVLSDVRKGQYEYVFHLAAKASVPYSVSNPVASNNVNVTKTLALLEACKIGKVKKFIFSSSSAVYGAIENFPTTESSSLNPLSPYALQKKIIEDYCKMFYELYGLESICLRYFNVFGPRQAGSGPYANVISSWCENGIRSGQIRLDGGGKAYRDFVYVADVAKANLLAAKSDVQFGCFNVGSGVSIQISEILSYFQNFFGNKEVVHAPSRIGDPERTKADLTLSKLVLKYNPSDVTSETFYQTFKWYKENIK